VTAREKRCTPAVRDGRARKARQFADAFHTIHEWADEPGDVADACVTLAVHAGIAAADAICCARLGIHSTGDNHQQAQALLERADRAAKKHLTTLLSLKTTAGYSEQSVTAADLKRAERAMEALIKAMDATLTG